MKAVWKWILGIVLALVVVGALATVAYFWFGQRMAGFEGNAPFGRGWYNGPMMRGDGFGMRNAPMMRGARGFLPFGGFFFLGGLFRWVLFGALLFGAYWLGRRNARVVMGPRPTAATPPAVEPRAAEPPSDANPPSPA